MRWPKKRVTFSDVGSLNDKKRGVEDDAGKDGGKEDIRSEVYDVEASEVAAQDVEKEGDSAVGESSPANIITTDRKIYTNTSLKSPTATSTPAPTPTPTPTPTSTSPASPARRSVRLLAKQIAKVAAQICDDGSLLSDAESIPEDANVDSASQAAQTKCKTTVKPNQTKRASNKGPVDNPPKEGSLSLAREGKACRKEVRLAGEPEDAEDTNERAITTAQMRDTITSLLANSLQVHHQFVDCATDRAGDAAGEAAEVAFSNALGTKKRTKMQRLAALKKRKSN
ncbi:uncharacterized protein N0V89_009640 [Didymosphaeria variabile]|uniref:Uncharacterized protein n=1 Tax=Didymosphaeria variabile TaxID=1932322 RepID=A0A9W9C7G2_9PLEO|nr:uncharacterized protein N0V89_009640 [Didymosphaeria variabile]KAJ4348268.1 hypothetical protein N0V89_009640 [Didymosphaeria variabile]